METGADKTRAFIFAVLLHAVCLGWLLAGLWWSRPLPPPSVAGSVIEAVLVTAPPAASTARPSSAPRAPEPAAPPPEPQPEPRPEQSPAPEQLKPQAEPPKPDVVEQERVARLAQQQEQERRQREQEERKRHEQVLLEEKKQQEEAERKQRLAQMQREREQQLADVRRQREEAERDRKREEERLKQLEDRRSRANGLSGEGGITQPQLGNQGVNEDLAGRYTLAIQQAVQHNWIRPETVRPGVACIIRIVQIPGGEVISAAVDPSCPYDELGRRSIEAAVLKAQPLPYTGFESVFKRQIIFTFRAPEG